MRAKTIFLLCVPLLTVVGLSSSALAQNDTVPGQPWWDCFPRILQTGDADSATKANASVVLCGAADDPTWGLFGQRLRMVTRGERIQEIQADGMKALSWFEAFGTAGNCFVVELRKQEDGTWIKYASAPSVTKVFLNHWGWQHYKGNGTVRWVGVHNYFDNEDFARPYTRTHPRYGCPPMSYPGGRIATGYEGAKTDPRNSRVYDAGCAKNVFGKVPFTYGFNALVNTVDEATGKRQGPIAGLLKVGDKYTGNVSPGKDAACPLWIDYARASVRQALDAGIDGLWCDNFSAWDDFSSRPISRAFGEWSVATFRDYLNNHFTTRQLAVMGIGHAEDFDVRVYLRRKCRQWGGKATAVDANMPQDPFDSTRVPLRDRSWRDSRWLDDPVWRAYLIHKRQQGTKALTAYYRAIKEEAAAAGKPDFLVSGNDIPAISLGWARGNLDMVSTELSWGWGLASGKRGFMPPPRGSYAPLYKLAREHAKSRFVNVWMYVPKAQWHKPGITDVLYYQALANHTMPMPHVGSRRTVGSEESAASFHGFVRRVAADFGERQPVVDVGLYFSTSSQLMSYTPGGQLDHDRQRHVFAHWGWGTALGRLQLQYRALPEWKLTPEELRHLKVLIIPNSIVFPPEDVPTLQEWVKGGGKLIVTGRSGLRGGEKQNFARLSPPSLAGLTEADHRNPGGTEVLRHLGRGSVLYSSLPIGFDFFRADAERAEMLAAFRRAISAVTDGKGNFVLRETDAVPPTLGLVTYSDEQTGRFFIDVNNTDVDLKTDTIAPAAGFRFVVRLPKFLVGREVSARVLAPGAPLEVNVDRLDDGTLAIRLPSIKTYACVILE
ncbi:MAG: hypothetical protein KAI66_19780 [Lentisphaeria bacterium]|nr:hypothetical protein [Lentisphaeria bacterium]